MPSLSETLALRLRLVGDENIALLAGLVRLTLKGLLVVTISKAGLLVVFSFELIN